MLTLPPLLSAHPVLKPRPVTLLDSCVSLNIGPATPWEKTYIKTLLKNKLKTLRQTKNRPVRPVSLCTSLRGSCTAINIPLSKHFYTLKQLTLSRGLPTPCIIQLPARPKTSLRLLLPKKKTWSTRPHRKFLLPIPANIIPLLLETLTV